MFNFLKNLNLGKRRKRRRPRNIRNSKGGSGVQKEPIIINNYDPPVFPIPDFHIVIIGTVLGTNKAGEETLYMSNNTYEKYFERLGKVSRVSCYSREVRDCDLLVLPGGADINPLRYNTKPTLDNGSPNLAYEWFETNMLPKYIEAGVPVAGICRGFQNIAIEHGCSLIQHKENLPKSVKSGNYKNQHKVTGNRSKIVENLEFTPKFKSKFEGFSTGINSLHHQTVNPAISDQIHPIAYSKEYGNLEILSVKGKNIAGFAYHPEELVDKRLTDFVINELIAKKVAEW